MIGEISGKIAIEEHVTFPDATSYFFAAEERLSPDRVSRLGRVVDALADLGERRVETMKAARIDCSILSLISPGVQIEPDLRKAADAAGRLNDQLAAAIDGRPAFAGFAHLALQSPDDAARELERCITQLGFVGFMINGHSCGTYLDDPGFEPIWERATALGAPLYLHPAHAPQIPEVSTKPIEMAASLWGWMAETGGHALRMMLNGVFDRHPDLQLVLGHMGEALPFLSWRMDSGVRRMLPERRPGRMPSDYLLSNVHATTSGVLSTPSLKCTLETMGADRVLFATDYPLEDSIIASDWLDGAGLEADTYRAVARENALRLFPGLADRLGQSVPPFVGNRMGDNPAP